ncbi:uncharacterized protein LOC133930174 [Phragmites australis]|uniref:uncharacterized protein LOC133930174 n=1 Tax=Phragmites australis TaxID=29695 RepID=UPI002D785311|nr:uncharacterized protein LOC133930174 [Phragmites australis]
MGESGDPPAGLDPADEPAWKLRKYLILLAILMATVTYVAGLDPPGGVWLETNDGHRTGNPILPDTRRVRYSLFYYSNATGFAASLVVIIILLFTRKFPSLRAVRGVMVLGVLCLMVAYVAGSSRGLVTTIYASVLSAVVLAFVVLLALMAKQHEEQSSDDKDDYDKADGQLRVKERRKILMLLAIFVTTITYTAALNPPGGFWEHAQEGPASASHRAGDPILLERHSKRFVTFLVGNTTAFSASLVIITLLLSRRLWNNHIQLTMLYGGIAVALLGLMVAYAAGSCRERATTICVVCLVVLVVAYIFVVAVLRAKCKARSSATESPEGSSDAHRVATTDLAAQNRRDPLDRSRSLILLLATLAATVTYQAGLNPPGGVWRDNEDGHNGGDLILLAAHARRYKVFFYFNSAAFVASIVLVIMVQSRSLVNRHALEAAVILDLFGLMGAYAAGSCRDVRTSIYVFALAAVVFVVVVIHIVVQRNSNRRGGEGKEKRRRKRNKKEKEKKRKLLLLLAILAVTITYQAGLTPPGKFWVEHGDKVHHIGDPVLADNYPRRYQAFFYCNATSFMVSVAVIVILVGHQLYDANKRYWWLLYFCMAAGLMGLLGAYAVGTTRRVRTSIYVFCLVGAVTLFAILHIRVIHKKFERCMSKLEEGISERRPNTGNGVDPKHDAPGEEYRERYRMSKYLLLLGILAASVTYQAGLAPPGGVWPVDGDGHAAGDPALHEGDRLRYNAFFYSNSACFVASVVVIVLLLQSTLLKRSGSWLILAMKSAVMLDLLGLLMAYIAGSSREWGTSVYVLVLATSVLAFVAIYVVLSSRDAKSGGETAAEVAVGSLANRKQGEQTIGKLHAESLV